MTILTQALIRFLILALLIFQHPLGLKPQRGINKSWVTTTAIVVGVCIFILILAHLKDSIYLHMEHLGQLMLNGGLVPTFWPMGVGIKLQEFGHLVVMT